MVLLILIVRHAVRHLTLLAAPLRIVRLIVSLTTRRRLLVISGMIALLLMGMGVVPLPLPLPRMVLIWMVGTSRTIGLVSLVWRGLVVVIGRRTTASLLIRRLPQVWIVRSHISVLRLVLLLLLVLRGDAV